LYEHVSITLGQRSSNFFTYCHPVDTGSNCTCFYYLLGLLRPLVFYNLLAIGQKDRLTGQP